MSTASEIADILVKKYGNILKICDLEGTAEASVDRKINMFFTIMINVEKVIRKAALNADNSSSEPDSDELMKEICPDVMVRYVPINLNMGMASIQEMQKRAVVGAYLLTHLMIASALSPKDSELKSLITDLAKINEQLTKDNLTKILSSRKSARIMLLAFNSVASNYTDLLTVGILKNLQKEKQEKIKESSEIIRKLIEELKLNNK